MTLPLLRSKNPFRALPRRLGRSLTLATVVAAGALAGAADAATTFTVSLIPSDLAVRPGEDLVVTVRVDIAQDPADPKTFLGAQVVLNYDEAVLEPAPGVDFVQTVTDGLYAGLTAESPDASTGDFSFFVYDPTFAGGKGSSDIATVHFRVKSRVTHCSAGNLLNFAVNASEIETALSYLPRGAGDTAPTLVNLPEILLDDTAPTVTVTTPSAEYATDAGSTYGATVADPRLGVRPTVTIADDCDASPSLTLLATLADGSTTTSWPAMFPIGVNTIDWTGTDAGDNAATVRQTIVVGNYQLMDVAVVLDGAAREDAGISARSMRLKAGSVLPGLYDVLIDPTNNTGFIADVRVAVAAGYGCVCGKDVLHSLSDTAGAVVNPATRKYDVAFALRQGDSNNDDVVDIVDYSLFLVDFGTDGSFSSRSNFNADGFVNNGDFGFINMNFFRAGETCGAFAGGTPRSRISLKELRRNGLGHLAVADLNGDGWVDTADMQQYVQQGGASTPSAAKSERPSW
jgi:hypothetical protein